MSNALRETIKALPRHNWWSDEAIEDPEGPYMRVDDVLNAIPEDFREDGGLVPLNLFVCTGDDHDYDAMSQWLIGVFLSEKEAEAAGEADEARVIAAAKAQGATRVAHNYTVDSYTILLPANSAEIIKRLRECGDTPQDVSDGEWAEWSHETADVMLAQSIEITRLRAEVEALKRDTAPTHRHVKRGTEYRHIGNARVQTDVPLGDMERVEVYQGTGEDDLWVRRESEFHDGRFEKIEPPKGRGNTPFFSVLSEVSYFDVLERRGRFM